MFYIKKICRMQQLTTGRFQKEKVNTLAKAGWQFIQFLTFEGNLHNWIKL